MTLDDLIKQYRQDCFDLDDQKPFCSDDLLIIYANEAQVEACRRGQLLRDSVSPMCRIAFLADAETVDLDSRVVRILRAFISGQEVGEISVDEMDCYHPGWQFQEFQDLPQRLVAGMTTGKLHLWPRPAADGELRLTVQRLPLKPMRACTDKPEIRPELHFALVHWMLYRAYSREDTDMHNDAKAAVALAKFEAEFGRKASGRNEEWVRSREVGVPGPLV